MEEKKNNLKQFKEIIKTSKGKALIFFGVYLVFFLILAVLSRISGTGNTIGSSIKLDPYSYNLTAIKNDNYSFLYQYNIDGINYNFSGKKNNKKSLFSDGVSSYYQNDLLFMKKEQGIWIKCENPYYLYSFLDVFTLEKILNSATYVSKTQLATGDEEILFQITTNTLVKILENIDVDLDLPVNTILLKKDKTGIVKEIEYKLTSYASYKNLAKFQFDLSITYSDFDSIEEIGDPA